VIRGIIPRSAAGEAGLTKGDRIVAVDGKPAKDFALWQLQDRLKKSGDAVTITIERGDETLEKTLALRAIL
jgi:S1-C subfamily serine protease